MRQLTLKDFVDYNSPCRLCNKAPSIELFNQQSGISYGNFELSGTNIKFTLNSKYNPENSTFIIFNAKTNNYTANFDLSESSYGEEKYRFKFVLYCKSCVMIHSATLVFEKDYIKPFKIDWERVNLKIDNREFIVLTESSQDYSSIWTSSIGNNKIQIPSLPISKWKTKEKLVNTVLTYLTFS